ncbi:discoidin domain-containing protein [Paenibacillus mendelii]|uniref:Discoidin domain-containing protein n=1 Tax=Paenibacillus mendelii TaxID=206163 RepID=A0ABV6JB15_9BACL|nr:discoidin domain-containing protein [Paenibacillus mendelii]MCQ6562970.1 discoidin domain-containing protein [Paenibacillus mendelii]
MTKNRTKKGWMIVMAAALLLGLMPVQGTSLLSPAKGYADPPVSFGELDGIDDLNRKLPVYGQVPTPRSGKQVGIFYFLWAGQHGTGGPYDITKIRQTDPTAVNNPSSPLWGPAGSFHHWGESLLNYYLADDSWVLRKHVQLLTDAGIDFLVFDATNAYTYKNVYDELLSILDEVQQQGRSVPKIVFYTNSSSGTAVTNVYNDLYSPGRYSNLWFMWKGKPLIIGNPSETSSTIQNFFTFRLPQWPNEGAKTNGFPWIEFQRPQRVYYNNLGEKEVVNVSVAQHPSIVMSDTPFYNYGGNWGRSFHNGANDTSPGAVNYGYNIAEQWDFALAQDPQLVFITGWNEWMAQRFAGPSARPIQFIDQATQDFSRDIEPMKDGHKDNYYMQMVHYIRKFKGMGPQQTPSAKKTITINTDFTQWQNVGPEYRDYTGDTEARNHGGYGGVTYTNTTGRNDLEVLKVARDDTNIYFYAKTAAPITSYTGAKWMRLFIDTDDNGTNGWKGYDYILNRTGVAATTTTLESSTGGWSWTSAATVNYSVSGNEMHVAIPRSALGLTDLNKPLKLKFKWSDNMQSDGDPMDFYVNGDAAPGARFNYVYTEDTSPAAPLAASDVNVALYKPVTSSSSVEAIGWYRTNSTDGLNTNGWSSNSNLSVNHTEWIQIDLGSNTSVNKVNLWPRGDGVNTGYGFPVNFTIQLSTDGTTWSTVITRTGFGKPNFDVQNFPFSSQTARYVKTEATSLRSNPNDSNSYRLQFSEIEVFGSSTPASYVRAWPFTSTTEDWTAINDISGFSWQSGGYVGGTVTGTDPSILSAAGLGTNLSDNKKIKVRMKNSTSSTLGQIYFATSADPYMSEAKHKDFTIIASDSGYTEYVIDMSTVPGWSGTLHQLRLDPANASGAFSISSIEVSQ